jgi:hypothetical protein
MRHRILRFLFLFSSFIAAARAGDLPIFDAHIHYNADARAQYSAQRAIDILNRAGVERALVSSTPNDGTRELYRLQPDRVVPELRPYRRPGDAASWYRDADTPEFLARELKRGIYRGIGEFHLHARQTDTPVVKRVVALAVERNIPLHVHSDDTAVRELFAIDPKVKILWAHAGISADAAKVAEMLDRYPALWVELSLRSGDVAPGGTLDRDWRALFLKYPDKFLLGTDTWTPSRWDELESEHRIVHAWLQQLPQEIALKLAFRNARQLFPK